MASGEYLDILMFSRLTSVAIESEYSIYLHNKMLSANAKKRKKADLNIQYAMKMVRTDVIEYGRESGTLTWRVLIV